MKAFDALPFSGLLSVLALLGALVLACAAAFVFARRRAEKGRVAEENLRVRRALDAARTCLMLIDPDGVIIYLNASALGILQRAGQGMGGALPGGGSAQHIVGRRFDLFHRDPGLSGRIAGLRDTQASEIRLGDLSLQLILAPVHDARGERVGTVVEWYDRGDEAALRAELTELVDSAAAGDFSGRVPLDGKEAFCLQLAEGLNRLMEVVSDGVEDVARVLGALARGELTGQIVGEHRGTLGRLQDNTNATVARVREVLERIQDSAEAIRAASRVIVADNGELSACAEAQTGALEKTAGAMVKLDATVRRNADNAWVVRELAESANAVARRGGSTMRKMVTAMGAIEEAARRIEDIVGVIDALALQSGILAANAAVEAARAGEQGRGFAVVAADVRALARRSAQSAREVKGLIADSVGQVAGGVRLVDEAGRTMEEIVAACQRVADLVGKIADAGREQSLESEQVAMAVDYMDETTRRSAALMENAAAAAAGMEDQAQELMAAAGAFFRAGAAPLPASERAEPVAGGIAKLPKRPARRAPLGKVRKRAAVVKALQDEWEEF